jgi:DNA polymerase III subunit beta
MKLEILREHLDKAAQLMGKVSNKNLSLPVLACAVFVVTKDRAVLRATNLDVSVEVVLKAKVHTEGVVAVPAHILAQTVAAFSDQKLTLDFTGSTLTVKGEHSKSSIATIDASEFPTLPYVKEGDGVSVRVPTKDITALIKNVSFAASTSSMKPELASIALTLTGTELVSAATDSFRLAEARVPVKVRAEFGTTLIPARNAPDVVRFIEGTSEVEVRVAETQCTFLTETGFITSRTVDGAFPDYRGLIPKEFVASATALREDVVRAFRKVSIFADSFNQVHIALVPSKNTLSVQSSNTSVGATDEEIPSSLEGDDIEINFNAKYITEALSVMGGDSATFSIAGPGKPMVIEDSPKRGFLYLVMPMNR